jgi:micrococcal nuclease
MLNRKQKMYVQFFIIFLIVCIFIYQYAYEKGYTNGFANIPNTKPSSQQKTNIKNTDYSGVYNVVHVADGDTIDIEKDGSKVRLRLLGINSPESVAKNRPSMYMSELAVAKKVRIELDSLKPEKDEYGRVLAYVWREDGLFINKQMIQSGNAYEYTYNSEKYKFQNDFKTTQRTAKEKNLGLWSTSTCNGKK